MKIELTEVEVRGLLQERAVKIFPDMDFSAYQLKIELAGYSNRGGFVFEFTERDDAVS